MSLLFVWLMPGVVMAQNGKVESVEAQNVVRTINSSPSGAVDVELNSTREFPVRNAIIQLHIGSKTYRQSRSPDGSLNNLVFTIPAGEFTSALNNGDPMWVDFHGQEQSGLWWDFGMLDKSKLNLSQ